MCLSEKSTSVSGLSVNNTDRLRTRPVFGTQSSTKLSTKLCAYFLHEIGHPSLCAESGEGMRGTTNVLGLNSASDGTAVQSSIDPLKV